MVCRPLQHFSDITAIPGHDEGISLIGRDWVDDVKYCVGLTLSPDKGVVVKLMPSKSSCRSIHDPDPNPDG